MSNQGLPQVNNISYADRQREKQQIKLKLELQGQCKIQQVQLLTLSYLKIFFFLIPLLLSIVGLFLLKYYKTLRAKIFYWQSDRENATHIYIRGNGKKNDQIVSLNQQNGRIYFYFKSLKYELLPHNQQVPVAINFEKQLSEKLNPAFLSSGLSTAQVIAKKALYGQNQHIVDPPQYFEYLYQIMTQPFFFVQYLAAVIYIVEKLVSLAILLLGASIITTSINYLLLYISYRKIKQIAEVVVQVEVLRNGQFQILPSTELVPGDIFIPKNDLYCDVVLLQGQVYVNQANLTGQSIPIGKFGLQSFDKWQKGDTSRWIYQGSKILSSQNALAIVMHTGYTSKRGRILRKILHRNPATPHFFKTCMYFLVINCFIGVIVYLGTLPLRLSVTPLDGVIILLNFLLVLTFCLPPSCPIYFNLVYSFSLLRLKMKDILGTQPEKTVEAAHLKIMCFDKTGTLTEDKVQVNKVLKFSKDHQTDITMKHDNQTQIDYKIFGSCHTVKYFQQTFMGDQIDLKMFGHSDYQLSFVCHPGSCFEVINKPGFKQSKIKILKIYQYQSRFQSMSVMAYDCDSDKYYIFVKGAPQIIHNNSITKYSYFDQLLQNVSYGGYRTIAYGYKEISQQQKDKWLNQTRVNFTKDIQICGLLVFQNKLKKDSLSTIEQLSTAGIQSRMITGDNVYIAIQTAIRCGILNRQQEVIVIQGKQQNLSQNNAVETYRFKIKTFNFKNSKVKIVQSIIQYSDYLKSRQPIVIDNDFLMFQKSIPYFQLSPKIRVYARVSPQNKAFIIRSLKAGISAKRKKIPRIKRLYEMEVDKIGMIGDGANDLLAIKQADIGVGIRNCDSSYAANFSVRELSGLNDIVKQSKCGQRNIIEIVRFISVTAFLSVPILIIMETEYSFYSPLQLIIGNITKYLTFCVLLALSRPAEKQTIYRPCSNFLKLQHQLSHWGNVIIGTLGYAGIVLYYRSTDEYVWNTKIATLDTGWYYQTSLVTSTYIYNHFNPMALIFCLYESSPWKQPFYKNYLLFIVFLINIAITLCLNFLVPQLQNLLSFADMSYKCMTAIFLLCVMASILTFFYNKIIFSLKLHQGNEKEQFFHKELIQLADTPVKFDSSEYNERRIKS